MKKPQQFRRPLTELCDHCAKTLIHNTVFGLNTRFHGPCTYSKKCVGGRTVHNVILMTDKVANAVDPMLELISELRNS